MILNAEIYHILLCISVILSDRMLYVLNFLGLLALYRIYCSPFIDNRSLRLLVHAFVTSRLDYCNGLLTNCSVSVRQRFQRIRNCAARLVCSEPALSHATPLLRRLHWLPVARRITYRLCVLMFDVFHGTAPIIYVSDRYLQ